MKLADWLKRNGYSQAVFAREIGVAQSTVAGYCLGNRIPKVNDMVKVHNATNGQVSADDFFRHVAARRKLGLMAGRKRVHK